MVREIGDLVKLAGQSIERSTLNGIKVASAKSGVSFQYLVAKAAQESSLQPDAQASTSSAAGLFQFTRTTWLDMMKRFGAQYGYGDLAQKIGTDNDGKPSVKDHAAEQRILALREDPEASALMAAEYARDNAASLQENLGRAADAPDLYLAHFLGPSGASQLLGAANHSPAKSAAAILPAAAKANTSVFYTPEGRARSTVEVVALVRDRFTGQLDRYAGVAGSGGQPIADKPIPSQPAPARDERANRALDMHTAMDSGDPNKMMMSWFMIEELGKLIAEKPMTMVDAPDDTGLSANGLQGSDWAAAMTNAFAKDAPMAKNKLPTTAPKGEADMASQAYGAVGGHLAALVGRPRRNDLG